MDVPFILTPELPENEHEAARAVVSNLSNLKHFVQRLDDANTLFDLSESQYETLFTPPGEDPPAIEVFLARQRRNHARGNWQSMAARDGALTIYDFYRANQLTATLRPRCPTLFSFVDDSKLREANTLFESTFKDFGLVRQAAAHPGEVAATPEKRRDNESFDVQETIGEFAAIRTIGDVAVFVSQGLINRRYTSTMNGQYVGYELSKETVRALESVADLIFQAFAPAEEGTKALLLARRLGKMQQPQQD